ncbi:MAG: phage portal protein [Candidatus Fimivivens sp.]|nr:phage portal protein [Candidatus Fimivivens sp.]
MNVFDRVLLAVNPKAACERAYYRSVYRSADAYAAGARQRGKDGWMPTNATGEQTNRASRDLIRARARDLERNDDMYKGIILDLERNVVGSGMVLQAKVRDKSGSELEDLNKQIEAAWARWCRPENCTLRGNKAFWEVQKLAVRRRFVDGGLLIISSIHDRRYCLQLVEVDDLDSALIVYGKNRVVGGIEIDDYDRIVAYHLRKQSVDGHYLMQSQRIEAKRVKFLTYEERVSQVREMTPSASAIPRADDMNQLLEAAIIKERTQACFGVAIETQAGAGATLGRGLTGTTGTNQRGPYPYQELTPGMILQLNPGDKVSSIAPSGMSSTADGMMRTIQRQAGAGSGLSYEAVSRDMSQTNYSSARQGMLQDRKTYSEWQRYLIDHMMRPIYLEWLQWAVLAGEVEMPPDYYIDMERYSTAVWIPPGWDWIDPLKESSANKIALETNQTTLQKICAQRGEDYRDVIAQRAAEQKLLKEMGLVVENKKEGGKTKDA